MDVENWKAGTEQARFLIRCLPLSPLQQPLRACSAALRRLRNLREARLAEEEGFEPPVRLPPRLISSQVP